MPRLRDTLVAFVALLLLLPAAAGAGDSLARRLAEQQALLAELSPDTVASTRLEAWLFDDASDGRLDEHTLLAAALVACGAQDRQELLDVEARLAGCASRWSDEVNVHADALGRARAIFEALHRDVLTDDYRVDCTDLRQVLRTGRFNCVSATLLFNVLAAHFGLEMRAIEIPGHAFSMLVTREGNIDVETTCPRWFALPKASRRRAAVAAAPPDSDRNCRERRELTAPELLSIIYYNRGIDLLEGRRFPQAVAANLKALRLDAANKSAEGNLLAALNNWALHLAREERFDESLAVIASGKRLAPGHEPFEVNDVALHQRWVNHLCRSGRYGQALEVLQAAQARNPGEAYFERAGADVYELLQKQRQDGAATLNARSADHQILP